MDLNALNPVQYSQYIPFSAASQTTLGQSGSTAESFENLLEKAESQLVGEKDRTPSKKPVIDKTDKLYEQCLELETFLMKTLLTGMRSTVQKTGFIDEGFAGKMYEDMLWDEYAKDFTKNAGFGLAEMAYLELSGQRGKLLASHA
jgi:flagellar protein FlgJ